MEVKVFEEGIDVMSVEIGDVKRIIEEKVLDFIDNIRRIGISMNATESLEKVATIVESMEDEAPDWVKMTAVAQDSMRAYSLTKPWDVIFGFNTCCGGASVSTTDGAVVTYEMERVAARDPEHAKRRLGHYPRIWRIESKGGLEVKREVVLEQDRLGRAGGIFGWDKYKTMIAAALASFKHNFQEYLHAFAKYAKAPLRKAWVLPNIIPDVNKIEARRWRARIMQPPTFCPPAVIRYRTKFPILNQVLIRIGLYNPDKKESIIGVEVWRYDKQDRAQIKDIEVPPGNSELRVKLKCHPLSFSQRVDISNGYVTVEPTKAEEGITVTYVTTEPKPAYKANPVEDMFKGLKI